MDSFTLDTLKKLEKEAKRRGDLATEAAISLVIDDLRKLARMVAVLKDIRPGFCHTRGADLCDDRGYHDPCDSPRCGACIAWKFLKAEEDRAAGS